MQIANSEDVELFLILLFGYNHIDEKPSISKRPKEVRKRETFGHWELDTVVSSRGKSKAFVAKRKTRHYTDLKMPDRTAYAMEVAFGVVASQYHQAAFQTVTVDRGKEFAYYANLQNFYQLKVYFADPYSPGNEALMRTEMA